MEEAVIALLLADPGVAAIAAARVFPGSRPQGSGLPAVVLQRISGAPLYADDGEVGLETMRLQIDCWANTYSEAKLLARAVRACLSGFSGTAGTTEFHMIELDAERDLRQSGANASEYPFRTVLDFTSLAER